MSDQSTAAGVKPTVGYWHLYVDEHGVSRQAECALDNFEQKSVGGADPQWNDKMARGESTVVFTVQPAGWVGDWHENPAPQWIVVLSGRWWIESMDGVRIEQGPGEFSFGEDQGCKSVDGKKGHRIRNRRRPALLLDDRTTPCRSATPAVSSEMRLTSILGFRLVTADPARIIEFYRALGFEIDVAARLSAQQMDELGLVGAGSRIGMKLGPSRVDLDVFEQLGRPYPMDMAACDLVFQHLALVTDDAAAAWGRAEQAGASRISRDGPVTLPMSSGGVTAVKFRDPEGHPLEFLQFPRGVNADWRGTGILGVDHSAICVSEAPASQSFYAALGLREGEATLNRGPAQQALDGLVDATVDVVPMIPSQAPPHLELLSYRHSTGQVDVTMAANDIAATRIVWRADRDDVVRDPDGHWHELRK